MIKVVFVGSNPSVRSPDNSTFNPKTYSGKVLRRWVDDLPTHNIFINLSNLKTTNNTAIKQSYINIESILEQIASTGAHRVVAIGNTTRITLERLGIDHYCLPHPSGLNRQCNDKNFINMKIKGLKSFILEP